MTKFYFYSNIAEEVIKDIIFKVIVNEDPYGVTTVSWSKGILVRRLKVTLVRRYWK